MGEVDQVDGLASGRALALNHGYANPLTTSCMLVKSGGSALVERAQRVRALDVTS